jgi:hypothetical protein
LQLIRLEGTNSTYFLKQPGWQRWFAALLV